MAQKLFLDIIAKDKTKAAFGAVQRGLTNLRSAVFSVQSALIGIGGGLAVRSLVNVGREVEELGIRFNFLFGNVDEGKKAFDGLIDFAAKVPFSLQEIAGASGNLAVVAKDADELQNVLKITGNVAAVTGLDFRTTAEQIQRSFSSGIGAADLFRERGVRALLGFKAGAVVTTEETIKRFEELFGENGRFSKATEVLATTFTGTLSMLGDKLFKFKLQTNQAGFFDFIKNALVVINRLIEENSANLAKFSSTFGQGMVNFIKQLILGVAGTMDTFMFLFKAIGNGLAGLIELIRGLPPAIREMGIIGFLMLGRTGKIAIVGALALLKQLGVDLDKLTDKIFGQREEESMGGMFKSANKFIAMVDENIISSRQSMEELMKAATTFEKETEQAGINLAKITDNILSQFKKDFESVNSTIAKIATGSLKSFSRTLAEAVVLGKDLNKSFKELAQKLMVDILAFTIQLVLQETIRNALKKEEVQEEEKKTAELRKQLKIQSTMMLMQGNPMGFLGFTGMAKGGAVSKGKPVVVGERGAELFVPNQTGQIQQAARGTNGGAVNVNFNISTIDARGFEETLVQNRGTITAIINDALNEKGRSDLV